MVAVATYRYGPAAGRPGLRPRRRILPSSAPFHGSPGVIRPGSMHSRTHARPPLSSAQSRAPAVALAVSPSSRGFWRAVRASPDCMRPSLLREKARGFVLLVSG
jgi:hypothetical protein